MSYMRRVYLDNAAATPVDKRVLASMTPFFSDMFYNPSALYQGARQVKTALNEARATVARCIGSKPSEIIFTAGGTESVNLAIHGVMKRFTSPKNVLISAVEHDAVYEPATTYSHTVIPVQSDGRVDIEKLDHAIDDATVLISVMLVNSEIGTIQPIQSISSQIAEVRKKRRKNSITTPLYFHVDACQAPLYIDVDVNRLGVDLLTLNGGKMYGPKQSGILYVRAGIELYPLLLGGGQEFGVRSGTENVAFAAGFAKALVLANKGRKERVSTVTALRDYFIKEIESRYTAVCNGSKNHRIANNVHVTFPDADNERILFALDEMGIDAAAGSACSASKEEPSRVLKAIGKTDTEAKSSIRFTLGVATTKEEIDYTLTMLKNALKA